VSSLEPGYGGDGGQEEKSQPVATQKVEGKGLAVVRELL
jgi:hypothetical protein